MELNKTELAGMFAAGCLAAIIKYLAIGFLVAAGGALALRLLGLV